ncbi:MAG: peptidoglycan-binding domain-containing protein, partial [Candidatus Paceibacterota bacterium]
MKSRFLLGIIVLVIVFVGAFSFSNTVSAAPCTITNTLRVGLRGDQVKCLQTFLSIKADGIFGKNTKAAVMAWQKNNKLISDGIFGPKSRNSWKGISVFAPTLPVISKTTCPNGMTFFSNCKTRTVRSGSSSGPQNTVISTAAIAGITAPVTGATPVTTTTAGTGYTGTVTWSGSPSTFASATIYTATITLTPTA